MVIKFLSRLQAGLFQSVQWLLEGFSGYFGLFWKRLEHKTQSAFEVKTSVVGNHLPPWKFDVSVSAFYIKMQISLLTWVSSVSH